MPVRRDGTIPPRREGTLVHRLAVSPYVRGDYCTGAQCAQCALSPDGNIHRIIPG